MKTFLYFLNGSGIITQLLMFGFVIRASRKGAHFNPMTYVLFVAISILAAVVTFFEKGNWVLMAAYGGCDGIISIYLICARKKFSFGEFEIKMLACTVTSVLIYIFGKRYGHPQIAIWACMASMAFATGVAMVDYYKEPLKVDLPVWTLYTISNLFCFIGAQPINVENSLISGVIGFQCAVVLYWGLEAKGYPFLARLSIAAPFGVITLFGASVLGGFLLGQDSL